MLIPIIIPIRRRIRYVIAAQSVGKVVCCDHCGEEYVHEMRRSAAVAISWLFDEQAAAARAQHKLERRLKRGREIVPCPACGFLQRWMVWRRRFTRLLVIVPVFMFMGMGCMLLAVFAGLPGTPMTAWSFLPAGVVAVLGCAACGGAIAYNDNAKGRAERRKLQPQQGVLVAELEAVANSGPQDRAEKLKEARAAYLAHKFRR